MQKNLLVTFLLFLAALNIYAQTNEQKLLKDYKFRINRFRAINLIGDQSSNFSAEKNNRRFGFNNTEVAGNFSQNKSTAKLIQGVGIGLTLNANFGTSKDTVSKQKNNSFSHGVSANFNNQYYFKSLYFVETNISAGIANNNIKQKTDGVLSSEAKYNVHSLGGVVAIGWGRLENITDMQNALWLTKALNNEKLLTAQLSNDEIISVAKALTAARNLRLLDNRRFIKNVLKQTNATLQKTNKLINTDIEYFTTLNDILFFSNNFFRNSGERIKFGASTVRQINDNNSTNYIVPSFQTTNRYNRTTTQPTLFIEYINSKPLSLKWQRTFTTTANYIKDKFSETEEVFQNGTTVALIKKDEFKKYANANIGLNYNYYPNTRTSIAAGGRITYGNNITNKLAYTDFGIGTEINYFLSYSTRLEIKAGINGVGKNSPSQSSTSINSRILNGNYGAKVIVTL